MKKTAIAIAVVVASFTSLTKAAPKVHTWYGGTVAGWSRFFNTPMDYQSYIGSNGRVHKNQIGVGVYVGYQAKDKLAIELGAQWLGRVPYKGKLSSGAIKLHNFQLVTKLSYPINNFIDAYVRLGGALWRIDTTEFHSMNEGIRLTDHDSGISPLAAAGLELAINKYISTRIDYQWISNVGNAGIIGTRPNNGLLSLSVSYRFYRLHDKNSIFNSIINNDANNSSDDTTNKSNMIDNPNVYKNNLIDALNSNDSNDSGSEISENNLFDTLIKDNDDSDPKSPKDNLIDIIRNKLKHHHHTPQTQATAKTITTDNIKKIDLKSDILFKFDSFLLKPEGKKILDQLYKKAELMNKTESYIAVIGFTDRLGSDQYNQELSQKRAESVLKYLIEKGIPSSDISVSGIGKANSITKDKCNNIKDHKSLIDCLSPDRRVEITIKGLKNIVN
ncbi:MAG: OmpA family protein [Pantoea sp. Brub]|nr:OmpA family protein [Pantoea sp. Brub]